MQEQYHGSGKTIAKNTFVLYLRMFLTLVVGLYTSRVVLSTLGIEDYGVYNVVGGIVGMLGFLNATMSGATSRFISYELGRRDFERLHQTFNAAFLVHVCIAILVLLISETAGVWFLRNKLVIPPGRESAAMVVLQASIFATIFGIITVPFTSCVIAHEKMEVYAYVEIYNVLAKLGIVFLLPLLSYDTLKTYAILLMLVSISVLLINNAYCRRHFEECHVFRRPDKKVMGEMMSFSAYNLIGNFGDVFNRQGIVILLNSFFGVVANAASGLATTVANMVTNFSNAIITAFRPPITKSYASGNIKDVERFSLIAFILAVYLFSLVAIPAGIEMEQLIDLWQEVVPENTVLFTRIILLCLLFEIIRYIAIISIHATGQVKAISICNGIILTINPIVLYFLYKHSAPVQTAYYCYLATCVLLAVISIVLMDRYIPELSLRKILWVIIKSIFISVLCLIITLFVVNDIPVTLWRIVLTTAVSSAVGTILFFYLGIGPAERNQLKSRVKKALRR